MLINFGLFPLLSFYDPISLMIYQHVHWLFDKLVLAQGRGLDDVSDLGSARRSNDILSQSIRAAVESEPKSIINDMLFLELHLISFALYDIWTQARENQ